MIFWNEFGFVSIPQFIRYEDNKTPESTEKVQMNNSLIPVALKRYHEQNLEKALGKGFFPAEG